MGDGWARVISMQFGGRLPVEITSIELRGLPDNVVPVGATAIPGGWKITLPLDLAANGNRLEVMLQWSVAPDDAPFTPPVFDLVFSVTGTLAGKSPPS